MHKRGCEPEYRSSAGDPDSRHPVCPWCAQSARDALNAEMETRRHLLARNAAIIRGNILEAHLQTVAGPEMRRIVRAALDGQTGDLRQLLNAMVEAAGDPPKKSA